MAGVNYYHPDHLSNRVITNSAGAVIEQMGHLHYGENWYDTGNQKWKFTTYERDAESSNDYAMARYHVNRLGRFSSHDPLSGSIADPQSLNQYPYVENDPINLIDPTGRDGDFYEDPNCDVHITNVNPRCGDTDCAGEQGCGGNGDPGGGTSGGGGGGLGPLDPSAGGQPGFASCETNSQGQVIPGECTIELSSFPNPTYDNLSVYVFDSLDPITGDLNIKKPPSAVGGPKPFGNNFGASFDIWAQPITKGQEPAFSMFAGASSSGPIKEPSNTRPDVTPAPPVVPTVPSTPGQS
jgi:RHS repeat-associated protein